MILGSNNTLYNIIIEDIIQKIIIEELKPGDKIYSVREQAKANKINPQTVQKAYNILIEKKILIAKVGSGNYVTDDTKVIEKLKQQFIDNKMDEILETIQKYEIDKEKIISKIKELDE